VKEMNRANGTKSAKVIQVIETKAKRGLGTEKDPVREVTQYWDFEGNFLAEMDTEMLIPQIYAECNAIKSSVTSE
jgi:hypothetical protein